MTEFCAILLEKYKWNVQMGDEGIDLSDLILLRYDTVISTVVNKES